ncbi:MATE family efflux transporter [Eisenbergiella tayi]|uniref:Probable multidrug resistance protein NorM n=1 Tax=Eisenbergiella tayi TaxID=1432052 RepID=A0A1E3AFF4_9FIRM|nr:MATE family efflux transporter [Eisenbergiella tayi]ODM07475.1 Multidrug resistance protein MdtK [Eisenbergiella tayi]ODR36706.1 MATE family efflux transporter [Eisenbergiella tayi]
MAALDMTKGSITGHLIRYSVPLIVGNLFQLAYNAVDSIIAGRFIGKEALAALGTAGPVMNIIILGISGICMGAGVLMSGFFGAGRHGELKKELSTILLFGLYFSLAVAVCGLFFARPLLSLLRVPDSVLDSACIYLKIIILGAPFTYFYNALAAALKSVGDSGTPVKFLMFASLLNGLLDLIFIGGLGFGIVCSAVTTVAAESVSAVLTWIYIKKRVPLLHPDKENFRIDPALLKKTLRYGGVTALQQACQPIGKLLIQGAVNPLGVDVIAAFQAVNRVDDFAFTPEQSISHGMTTFTAQNLGAEGTREQKTRRIDDGLRTGLMMEFLYWIFIFLVVFLARNVLMKAFISGEGGRNVVELGSRYLKTMAFFYLLPAFTNGLQGYFRGLGKMGITLAGTFIQTSIRVAVTYLTAPVIGIYGVALACAAGWSAMLLFEVPYLIYVRKKRNLLQGEDI